MPLTPVLFTFTDDDPTDPGTARAPGVHRQEPVPGGRPDFLLPLCWVAEGVQRGATAEEWEVSYDHQALPAVWMVPPGSDLVSCDECLEWIHA